jgi:exonuclease VII large subunit
VERKRRAAEKYRKWAAQNREHLNAKRREARKNNPERFKRAQQRRQANIVQNIASRIRSGINQALRRGKEAKGGRPWESLVGYSANDLIAHIERQFTGRMSWQNFGEWHIDHIIPVSSFRFASVDDPEFRACWALTNLRPLRAKANREKHAKRMMLL